MTERFDFEVYTSETYRHVVGQANPDEGIGRQEAMELAASRILAAIERGDVKPDLTDVVKRALLNADESQGKRADQLIKVFVSGQTSLDIDEDLTTVVTLGAGKRKLWRHCSAADLIAMDTLRHNNVKAAQDSYNQWRETFPGALAALTEFRTVENAVRSGAFGDLA